MDLLQRLLVHAWVSHIEVWLVIEVPWRVSKVVLILHKLIEHKFVIRVLTFEAVWPICRFHHLLAHTNIFIEAASAHFGVVAIASFVVRLTNLPFHEGNLFLILLDERGRCQVLNSLLFQDSVMILVDHEQLYLWSLILYWINI